VMLRGDDGTDNCADSHAASASLVNRWP
jgi:hypothetical protein